MTSLASRTVAPTWPLDRMIVAVNPLWERRDQPWTTVANALAPGAAAASTLTVRNNARLVDGARAEHHFRSGFGWKRPQHLPAQLLQLRSPVGSALRPASRRRHGWRPEMIVTRFNSVPTPSTGTLRSVRRV
jgi:hypothetical protein